jgi:hypothetical protein
MYFQKFTRHSENRFTGFPFGFFPGLTAKLVQRWSPTIGSGVFLHQIDALNWQIEAVSTCIFEMQIVSLYPCNTQMTKSLVESDAMIDVNDIIPSRQLTEARQIISDWAWARTAAMTLFAKDLLFGDENKPIVRQ